MDFEQAVAIVNTILQAQAERTLSDLELELLKGAWDNLRYEEIAARSGYSLNYLQRDVGPKFWRLLSDSLGRKLNKTNAKAILIQKAQEQALQAQQLHQPESYEQESRKPASQGQEGQSAQGSQGSWDKPTFQDVQQQDFQRQDFQRVHQNRALETNESLTLPFSSLALPSPVVTPYTPFSTPDFSDSSLATPSSQRPHTDWGEAIDVSIFYGREQELATLTEWILGDDPSAAAHQGCRLIALLGMGGIGKSSLAAKVADQVQHQFEFVVWRSLRNAPPLETLLADLVPFLSQQHDTQARPNRLLHWLRQSRCLVILDNVETIMQAGDRAGSYQMGYENYGDLFRLLGETIHQSCIVLTSREKPAEISMMEYEEGKVRSLALRGCQETAIALLDSRGLQGTEAEKQQLCHDYSYSPLALKIIAASIQTLFDGKIAPFLAQHTLIFNNLRRLLDQQAERLSTLERSILYWLAINREWTPLNELQRDLVPPVTRSTLLEALESLTSRGLIEQRAGHYTQQPVLMEYMTDGFIERIVQELSTVDLDLFLTHALLKTTVKDYIRETQERLILKPIAEQLIQTFHSQAALEQHVFRILPALRRLETKVSGYGPGNVLNLLHDLPIDRTGLDFSHLTIRQANLARTDLHRVNFAHAVFDRSMFTRAFGSLLCVTFSPDQQHFATSDSMGEIQVWRVADCRPVLLFNAHDNLAWAVAFSPDGTVLASCSEDQTIKLWDAQTGAPLRTLPKFPTWTLSVAFSPDGTMLASSHSDHSVRLWDVETGTLRRSLNGHDAAVVAVAFSPTGLLASGGKDCVVHLWDVSSGDILHTLEGHQDWIGAIAFSPTGDRLASGSKDNTVRLWDVKTGDSLRVLQQGCRVRSLAFTTRTTQPGDRQTLLASTGESGLIKLWDADSGRLFRTIEGSTGRIWSLDLSRDGQLLISAGVDQQIRLWSVQTGRALQTLQGYTFQVRSVALSPDGRHIASGGTEQKIRIWDLQTGQSQSIDQGYTDWGWVVAFNASGTVVASGSDNQIVRLWDVATGECLKVLEGHTYWIWAIAFSQDGRILASASEDQTVRLWDVQRGQTLHILDHERSVYTVAFDPTGQRLASGGEESNLRIWDVKDGTVLHHMSGHTNWIRAVSFSPDGSQLASGSTDGTVRLWDAETGSPVHQLCGHGGEVWSVAFSPEGRLLASCSEDHTIRLWHVSSGECLRVLDGHAGQVRSLAWGRVELHGAVIDSVLISGSIDGTLKLWAPETGDNLKTLQPARPYEGMNITGVSGITEAQKTTLYALGAFENASGPAAPPTVPPAASPVASQNGRQDER